MSIPEATIQNILNTANIVEVIEDSVRLIKTGRNYKACCPFHKEKTASFIVSAEKQIFHCFGCNAGGNAIGFLMKMEGLTYPDAIRKLARKYSIDIKETDVFIDDKASKEKETIYKILEEAGVFYQKLLAENSNVKNWIKKRGINTETIEKFRIGYSPPSAKTLLNAAIKKGYTTDILYKSGIISSDKDFFYNRIMFPIFDVTGRIIAFGGRVLDDKSMPKYLNSPESAVYSKSRTLYAMNFAGKSIRDTDSAIILEGYIDVIMCHQYGITNTVATLGTAFTTQHASILKRYTDNVTIAYDPDNAGRSSSLRSAAVLLADDLCVKIAQLPDGKDSDEILLSDGSEKLTNVFANSISYIDFLVTEKSKEYNLKSVEGKRNIAKSVLPVISKIPNAIVKSEYMKTLAEKLDIKEDILNHELNKVSSIKNSYSKIESAVVKNDVNIIERNLISVLIRDLKLLDNLSDIEEQDFNSVDIWAIFNILRKLKEDGKTSVLPAELLELSDTNIVSQILISDCEISNTEKFIKSYSEAIMLRKDRKNLEQLKNGNLNEFLRVSKMMKGTKK
ncbi:MAG: DNA primase [Elusimicrobia bacterium RIFOXYD2_FULL_34_15]|nr:MAG: DNA primase [Elusimicrobia bacterium RIFOXYD2_FULL_34_15]